MGPQRTPLPLNTPNSDIDWPTFGFTTARSGENAAETTLTPSTVGGLHLLWSRKIGNSASMYADTQPVVAANVLVNGYYSDVVYAGDEHGFLVAVNAATGSVIWRKHLGSITTSCGDIPDTVFGITDTVTLDRGTNRLYVVDGDGRLWAFDLSSGKLGSGWPSTGLGVVDSPALDHVWSGLTFNASTHLLFVPTASYCDFGNWNGSLRTINTESASVIATFYFGTGSSTVDSTNFGGGIWSWGGIAIDPDTQLLFGASGNLVPSEDAPYSDSMTVWNASLAPLATSLPPNGAGDGDFGGSSIIYDDAGAHCVAAVRKEGTLFIFDRTNVENGPVTTLTFGGYGSISTPAHSSVTHLLYVVNPISSIYAQGLYAFQTEAGCTINPSPVWSQPIPTDVQPVTVAGSVVYAAAGSQLYAFNATTGAQLWTSSGAIAGAMQNGPTVINGHVYVVDWNDTLYAFGL